MDDCTVVCLFLNTTLPHNISSYAGKTCNGNSNPSSMIETSEVSTYCCQEDHE